MRPKSISAFELIYLTALFVGVIVGVMTNDSPLGFILVGQVMIVTLVAALVLSVSRKRSKGAAFVLIGLNLFELYGFVQILLAGSLGDKSWVAVAQSTSQLIAIGLLTLPSSRMWLANKDEPADIGEIFS